MEASGNRPSVSTARKARSTARSTLAVLLGSVVIAAMVGLTAAAGATGSPPTGTIAIQFPGPPTSFVDARVTDPDTPADKLTFTWEVTIGCGSWQLATRQQSPPLNNGVDWWHGDPPGDGPLANKSGVECSHTDDAYTTIHTGTFTVTVTDDTGNAVKCTITGHTEQEQPCQPVTPTPSTSTSDTSVDLCVRVVAVPVDAPPSDIPRATHDTCTGEQRGITRIDSGERLSYTYTVTNRGPAPATGVVLKDHMIFKTIDGGACRTLRDTDTISCQLGVVDPDVPISRNVIVEAKTGVEDRVVADNVRVTTKSFDRDSSNNRAAVGVEVNAVIADLVLSFRSVASIEEGDRFTAIAVVTNNGPRRAESVKLTGGADGAAVVAAKQCSVRGNDFTCVLGGMKKGEEIKRRITFRDKKDVGGSIFVDGKVKSPTPDPNPKNNDDSDTTRVR